MLNLTILLDMDYIHALEAEFCIKRSTHLLKHMLRQHTFQNKITDGGKRWTSLIERTIKLEEAYAKHIKARLETHYGDAEPTTATVLVCVCLFVVLFIYFVCLAESN